jgi:hypothetical protein
LARTKPGQMTERIGHLNMFRPKRFFQDCQGLTVEGLGLGIAPPDCMDIGEGVQALGYFLNA